MIKNKMEILDIKNFTNFVSLIKKRKNQIVLFDLDSTLIKYDTLKLFVLFMFTKKPINFFLKVPILSKILIQHFFLNCNHKTLTKSKFYSKLFEGFTKIEVENFSKEFSKYIYLNYKKHSIYKILLKYQNLGIENYIITASGDIYCKHLAKMFQSKLISTKINLKKNFFGKIIGKNCYGKEKKRVLKEIKLFKKKYSIFFTDSYSDHPLATICDKSYLIK